MAALHNRRMRYLGGMAEQEADLIAENRDNQLEVPMDEDEDLFAPEHEYIEKPLPVLKPVPNQKNNSAS